MSNSPNDSMMRPVNVSIVYVKGAAMMVIIPILIVGNSFSRIPSDSPCIVISGLAWTTCSRLFTRLYSSYIFQGGAEWPWFAVTRYSWFSFCVVCLPCDAITSPYNFRPVTLMRPWFPLYLLITDTRMWAPMEVKHICSKAEPEAYRSQNPIS